MVNIYKKNICSCLQKIRINSLFKKKNGISCSCGSIQNNQPRKSLSLLENTSERSKKIRDMDSEKYCWCCAWLEWLIGGCSVLALLDGRKKLWCLCGPIKTNYFFSPYEMKINWILILISYLPGSTNFHTNLLQPTFYIYACCMSESLSKGVTR